MAVHCLKHLKHGLMYIEIPKIRLPGFNLPGYFWSRLYKLRSNCGVCVDFKIRNSYHHHQYASVMQTDKHFDV